MWENNNLVAILYAEHLNHQNKPTKFLKVLRKALKTIFDFLGAILYVEQKLRPHIQ